jgi:hypothetical protein
MKRLLVVSCLIAIEFVLVQLPAGSQTLSPDNTYVLHATPRQVTTSAPLTLTFNEYFMQGKKQMVRRAEVTIPPTDVNNSLTARVAFVEHPASEVLFVLNVRSRNIPATTSAPLVLTLASGLVVTIPQSAVHEAATNWLRGNLSTSSSVSGTATTTESVTATITAKCAKDWPDDFRMRKYCQDQQLEGIAALQRRTMDDSADHQTIRKKCANDWPDDYRMRDYCEVQQLKALAAIGK